jgi:hypothetical protein
MAQAAWLSTRATLVVPMRSAPTSAGCSLVQEACQAQSRAPIRPAFFCCLYCAPFAGYEDQSTVGLGVSRALNGSCQTVAVICYRYLADALQGSRLLRSIRTQHNY